MLAPENQVLIRNIEHLPAGRVLLLDAIPDHALDELCQLRPDITWHVYTPYFDTANTLASNKAVKSQQISIDNSAWFEAAVDRKFDAAVVYFPKAKARFDYYLSMMTKSLKPDAELFIVGEKKGGVKGCEKALKPFVFGSKKIDSARHCMLFTAVYNDKPCVKTMTQWFSETSLTAEISGQQVSVSVASLPGVFSANRLDDGTDLLLKNMQPVNGKGIDFGCGCGVISLLINKVYGAEIVGVDVDALAIASSRRTFELNESNATAVLSNGLSELLGAHQKYDFIVSNPPFHTGLKTDYSIVDNFLKNAKTLLKNKYEMWVVANSFLPYPELFQKYLQPAKSVSNNKRFTVYQVISK